MQLFYTKNIQNKTAIFDAEETKHCTKTLRKNIGDVLRLTDGQGHLYEAELTAFDKKSATLRILQQLPSPDQRSFKLHIAIAPTKNNSRLEWFLEKATELGIDEVSFIRCQRSERKNIRLERLEKIVLAAAKQSLKTILPVLHPLRSFKEVITTVQADFKGIAHCNIADLPPLKESVTAVPHLFLLIGPEGDFSVQEVEWAKEQGFQEIGLGKSRLRTETAGLVACHTVHLMQ
ncbi:MAG: 16S rRNA (uracil(1498)-N(3))-methyltransferase [Aureispira sp.]